MGELKSLKRGGGGRGEKVWRGEGAKMFRGGGLKGLGAG